MPDQPNLVHLGNIRQPNFKRQKRTEISFQVAVASQTVKGDSCFIALSISADW